ncbi:hypothetical protein BCR44DRAFT_1435355 [Catenaria anguillulae PL171]|uniref:Uncharacterized protein n=1 Tax=Catenaria anguillulae PL171 TaxID=765915 RepID=A0A1Y2HLP4_9FUNG|nr:hypothetical protein BCR44DRAFT_1435355 [Catenaria anguillulae PL171]
MRPFLSIDQFDEMSPTEQLYGVNVVRVPLTLIIPPYLGDTLLTCLFPTMRS